VKLSPRVLAGARVRVAEDLDAAETDGRGDSIAVGIEIVGGLVADLVEVHLDAVDDGQEGLARDREGAHGAGQPRRDRILRAAARLVAERDVVTPALELAPLRGTVDAALVAEIGDVVHRPAECVDSVQGVPAMPWKREEGVVEVRATLPRQPGGQSSDHAICLASLA